MHPKVTLLRAMLPRVMPPNNPPTAKPQLAEIVPGMVRDLNKVETDKMVRNPSREVSKVVANRVDSSRAVSSDC
jgi:hypothetical protein